MRYVILLLVVAAALAELAEESWTEEEEWDEPYDEYEHERRRRDIDDSGPYEEHARVERCEERIYGNRERRSERTPRDVPQYEVHEHTEDSSFPSPPYEEMLAASAEHHHMYRAPGAPEATRHTEVSPGSFAVIRPVSAVRASNVNPAYSNLNVAPVLSLAPPPQQVADQSVAAGRVRDQHHGQREHGAGHSHHGTHLSGRGGKTRKGYSSEHSVDKGKKGFKTDHSHRNEYEEAAGKKKKHHDVADHRASHEEEAQGRRGAQFAEKKGHKKGHKTKGYHNKYHKDEFHKEHKFYDDFHKSGEHHRYGKFNAKHASDESGKKKARRVTAGHELADRARNGYRNKGHVDSKHEGHRAKSGHEEHRAKHSESGKRAAKDGGSRWGHSSN